MHDYDDIRVIVDDERGRRVGPVAWVSCSSPLRRGQVVSLTLGGRLRQFRVLEVAIDGVSPILRVIEVKPPSAG